MKFKACRYFICGGDKRPTPVRGFAVDGVLVDGEPVRIAVRRPHEFSERWQADDWDTGMALSRGTHETRASAIRSAVSEISRYGIDEYNRRKRIALMAGALRGDQ